MRQRASRAGCGIIAELLLLSDARFGPNQGVWACWDGVFLVSSKLANPPNPLYLPASIVGGTTNKLLRLEWAILSYGVLLRLAQYLSNRSLWLDESMLSLNIIHRNFAELLRPLDYNQGAPIGFLMLQKALVRLLGPGEYALRLFPFLCGLASLFLFYYLAKKCLERSAVPMAIALFAMVLPLIYYSSEAKQYSSDVVVTLCLLSVAVSYLSRRLTLGRILLLGLLGAISVWLSHPAVFVLAGIGGSALLFCALEKRWPDIARLSVAFALWILSFIICYFVSFRSLAANQMLLGYWSFSFPPSQPLSVAGVEWLIGTFFQTFQSPVGLDLSGVAALGFLVGCIYIYRKQKQTFAILVFPILLTLAAAAACFLPYRLYCSWSPKAPNKFGSEHALNRGSLCRGAAFSLPCAFLCLSPA